MPDREQLRALRVRLEGGELSGALLRAVAVAIVDDRDRPDADGWWGRFNRLLGVRASLDAAVALVERVLPGWAWGCGWC